MFVTMYCFRMPYWMRLGVHGIRDWEINWEFQRIINKEKALKYCPKAFSLPKQCQDVEATVVRQWQHCTLQIIRAPWHLSNTICSARKLPELKCSSGLNDSIQVQPPPPCSKFHSLLNYYQVMEWMGCSDKMQPSEWGWRRGQTYSSDDRQKLSSKYTDSDDSLQLFGRIRLRYRQVLSVSTLDETVAARLR